MKSLSVMNRSVGVMIQAGELHSLETADLEPFLRRTQDSRLVLLGEATHGTSEFYRMRARLSALRAVSRSTWVFSIRSLAAS